MTIMDAVKAHLRVDEASKIGCDATRRQQPEYAPVSEALKDVKKTIPSKAHGETEVTKNRRPYPESLDARDAVAEAVALKEENHARELISREAESASTNVEAKQAPAPEESSRDPSKPSPVSDALQGIKRDEDSKADPSDQQEDYAKHRRPFPESTDARQAVGEAAALKDEREMRSSA